MRYRNRLIDKSHSWSHIGTGNRSWFHFNQSGTGIYRSGEEMWDVDGPFNRHMPVKPVNPMVQHKHAISGSCTMHAETTWFTGGARRSRVISGLCPWPLNAIQLTSSPQTMMASLSSEVPDEPRISESYLLQKALANARTSGFDLSTFLAEFSKTREMITRFGTRTARRADNIRRRLGPRATASEFFSAWMEYRYGWRILMYDLEAMNDAVRRLQQTRNRLVRYTAYDERSSTKPYSTTASSYRCSSFSVGSGDYKIPITYHYFYDKNVRAGVGLTGFIQDLVLIDPLNTLSEVIPYHLVVNWFFNTKDLIAAWSPFARGQIAYAFVTTEHNYGLRSHDSVVTVNPGRGFRTEVNAVWNLQADFLKRERKKATPTLDLRFRVNLDFPRIVDLLAILNGKIPSRRR